ncbi:hypothetical protein ACFFRR_002891 [Megaselia abdita]
MVKECCCFGLKTGSILIGVLDLIKDSIIVFLLLNKLQDEVYEDTLKYQMFLILSAITITSSILLIIAVKWGLSQCLDVWLISKTIVTFIIGIFAIFTMTSIIASGEKDILQGILMLTLVISYVIGLNIYFITVVYSYKKDLRKRSFTNINFVNA